MRVDYTPTEPVKLKLVWNGSVVREEDVAAGQRYQMNAELPKVSNGNMQLIAVKADGTEEVLASDTHTVDAKSGDCGCGGKGGCGGQGDCGCGDKDDCGCDDHAEAGDDEAKTAEDDSKDGGCGCDH